MKTMRKWSEQKTCWCLAPGLVFSLSAVGCGYSQEEWDQKLRENESLQNQLKAQQQAHHKCGADFDAALQEVEELKRKLKARGINLDNVGQSLEEQHRALEEYRTRRDQLDALGKRYQSLRGKVDSLAIAGARVSTRDNRIRIEVPGDALFDSGKEELSSKGTAILSKIAAVIASEEALSEREFQVAGYTDSTPPKGSPYKDSWGLSAMRARAVVSYLVSPVSDSGGGLNPARWSAAGYGATSPVANNASEEGRAANRRIEIVVLPNVQEMLNVDRVADPVGGPSESVQPHQ